MPPEFGVTVLIVAIQFAVVLLYVGGAPEWPGQRRAREKEQGEILASWTVVPPLTKRLAVILAIGAGTVLWVAFRSIEFESAKLGEAMALMLVSGAAMFINKMKPHHYMLTGKGLWMKQSGAFSDPARSRSRQVALVSWGDVSAVTEEGDDVWFEYTGKRSPAIALAHFHKRKGRRAAFPLPQDPRDREVVLNGLPREAGFPFHVLDEKKEEGEEGAGC